MTQTKAYKAIIWDGSYNLGETTIPADQDLSDAMDQACEWAADGDYPEPGEVDVRLYGDDPAYSIASRTIRVGDQR